MKRRSWLPVLAVAAIVVLALVVPLLPLSDPLSMDVAARLAGPSWAHPLGQDEYGRDELARLLWATRTSLTVSLSASLLAGLIGTMLGVMGGYLRGVTEVLALRGADLVLCFPPVLLALLVVTLVGPGAGTLIFVITVLYVPGFIRVANAGVISVRSHEFVEAMRVLGAGSGQIMLRTILPNVAGPLFVQLSLSVAAAIILEAGLSFLGAGIVPPDPSWGLMIGAARPLMRQAPLMLIWPCLALTLTILAMNALCDMLRGVLGPQTTRPRGVRRVLDALIPGMVPPGRTDAVLDMSGLMVEIDTPRHGVIRPVRDVALRVAAGETLALVGESGSGKSLTGSAVLGLLPGAGRVAGGTAWFEGTDLLRLAEPDWRRLRGAALSMVFQDPMSGLNPMQRIGDQIAETVRAHQRVSAAEARARAVALLHRVGMSDPDRQARAYPHEMSGGMRQRVMIAIAIANNPRLIIADEPTASLDVTIQAQILDLLAELQRENHLALILTTHSLPVVAEIADRVAVMYAGEIVEQGAVGEVFARPLHPYTAALLASAPTEDGPPPEGIPGIVPPPHALPPGCRFAPRCTHRIAACEAAPPPLQDISASRQSRCIRWEILAA